MQRRKECPVTLTRTWVPCKNVFETKPRMQQHSQLVDLFRIHINSGRGTQLASKCSEF